MTLRNSILVGDVREKLRELPDESVHCVVTSPPYWGLRDYGTASWEGGDAGCEHANPKKGVPTWGPRSTGSSTLQGKPSNDSHEREGFKGSVCPSCGARRIDSQLGLEPTPEEFVCNLVAVFREVRRVLRADGTVWLNLGDSYTSGGRSSYDPALVSVSSGLRNAATTVGESRPGTPPGLKPKDLVGIPWRVAFALQADGWWLRSDIIWSKPNPMPESVTDRPTKAHEYLFLLSKSERYYYDAEAIKEPYSPATIQRVNQPNFDKQTGGPKDYALTGEGIHSTRHALENLKQNLTRGSGDILSGRNRRTVWEIPTEPYAEAHFATYPQALVKPCIQAGTPEHGCCAECGAPWERVVERLPQAQHNGGRERNVGGWTDGFTRLAFNGGIVPDDVQTTGWRPTCKHEAPTTPAVILDPFLGSGTTALVALKAGRDFVGIELNSEYAAMAEKRIAPFRRRLL